MVLLAFQQQYTPHAAIRVTAATGAVRKQVPVEPASDLVGDRATRADAEPPP
jgi:hypothetical protein